MKILKTLSTAKDAKNAKIIDVVDNRCTEYAGGLRRPMTLCEQP
jgi:hypothetical protein